MPLGGPDSERILVVALRRRDGEIATHLLSEAGFSSFFCQDATILAREMRKGCGCVIITDEAIDGVAAGMMYAWLQQQPAWSDLPIIALTSAADALTRSRTAVELQDTLGNISFLERPFHPRTLASVVRAALRSRRRQYEARELLERYELLARELQHRTKNLMAVIQSIAGASLRDGVDGHKTFIDRLHALAAAQDLLMEGDGHGAYLADIVTTVTSGFGQRVTVDGPKVHLKPTLAQGFALVVHELATNAVKHGALRESEGNVLVGWSVAVGASETTLLFRWQEQGGPAVLPPERRSFGSILLERAVSSGKPPRFDYAPQGFAYELSAVLTA